MNMRQHHVPVLPFSDGAGLANCFGREALKGLASHVTASSKPNSNAPKDSGTGDMMGGEKRAVIELTSLRHSRHQVWNS